MSQCRLLSSLAVSIYVIFISSNCWRGVDTFPSPFNTLGAFGLNSDLLHSDNRRQTFFHQQPRFCPPDPDACRSVVNLISSKGYPVEEHNVTTDDGFVLTIHRIPHGRVRQQTGNSTMRRPVVFLQHGFADSAATWIMNSANQSLCTILADAGFDVWLGNVRGNTYSLTHQTINSSDPNFWKWSWDDMQKYDLPAMLNYALETTQQQQLYYIGHSQGTLIAFAGFSTNQALANKIRKFVALAPVATVGHVRGTARLLTEAFFDCKLMEDAFGSADFAPNCDVNRLIASSVCSKFLIGPYLCQEIAFLIGGRHLFECNVTRYQVIFSHFPAGTSVQNAMHFCQMSHSNKMAAYDFGSPDLNRQHYNQTTPPEYNPSNMTVPVILFSGTNDYLAAPEDVAWIASKLPNLIRHEVMTGWNHMDFVWGAKEAPHLYRRIVSMLLE